VAAMLDDLARVIRFEARGCGRSDPQPPYTIHMIMGADHHIWVTHAEAMRAPLRDFIQHIGRRLP
jgi:hypothetical protein